MFSRRLGLAALLGAWAAYSQNKAPLSFDVASVKPAAPCCAAGQWRESKAGEDRIDFRYVTLRYCVAFAYGVREFQVSGPPAITEMRYDIVAKGAAGTRRNEVPEMVKQMLAERFKLAAHHETKEFSVYVLAVGKKGPNLQPLPPDPNRPEGAQIGMSMGANGVGKMEVKHGGMTSLANTLVRMLGHPVLDQTGLTGVYDFELEYAPSDAGMATAPATEGGASVFTSLQRLGLTLESKKVPMDAIVVDRTDKVATEN